MPIVSGGSGGGSSGALTLLSTTTLAVDGTIDVTGIAQTYNDLRLILIARGTRAAATAELLDVRFNNDTGANYDGINMDAAVTSSLFSATSAQVSGSMPAANATAGAFGMFEILIPAYADTGKRKVAIFEARNMITFGSTEVIEAAAAMWNSTAAINRITFFGGNTANLLTGSTLRIYGVT